MIVVAWFQIVVGAAIVGLWAGLLLTRRVPQIRAGTRDIWFHMAAEAVTAAVLVVAGVVWLVTAAAPATTLSGLALGALLYTSINSAGYYANLGDWSVVAVFGALTAATTAAAAAVIIMSP